MESRVGTELMRNIITPEFPWNPLEVLGENDFKEPRIIPKDEIGTPVQEFYRDATLFVTGGTGFLGKTLVEKLLRSCPHISHIYMLVREKKGKSAHQRLNDILQDPIFKRLKHESPKFYEKLTIVNGNVQADRLGLSDSDRTKIIKEVNVIFHSAATVRFDETVAQVFRVNVLGTKSVLQLAKQVQKLKSIVHVSTAYSFCNREVIEEKIYPIETNYREVLKMMETMGDDEIEAQSATLLSNYPNSYTFAKGSAENMVKDKCKGLPLCIFRPAIVISTYNEPIKGWIDNVYGPMGLLIGMGTGIIHTGIVNTDKTLVPNMVPVDFTANGLICAAKAAHDKFRISKDNYEIPIYNFAKLNKDLPTWAQFMRMSMKPLSAWAAKDSVWYYSVIASENKVIYWILCLFLHTFFGYIVDGLLRLTGKQPRLSSIYKKFHRGIDILRFFICGVWTFKKEQLNQLWNLLTPEDKALFTFNLEEVQWPPYINCLILGVRVYLLKDGLETIPAARKKWKILYYVHHILKYLFHTLVIYLFYKLLLFFLSCVTVKFIL